MRILMPVALLSAVALHAASIDFNASFISHTDQSCFIACGPSPLPTAADDSFVAAFSLDSAQLAIDGSYDVTNSFSTDRLVPNPFTFSGLAITGPISAVVQGGNVTGLIGSYGAFYVTDPVLSWTRQSTLSITGSGAYRLNILTQAFRTGIEAEDGTFTISQAVSSTPEPGSASLALFVLAAWFIGSSLRYGYVRRQKRDTVLPVSHYPLGVC